VYRLFREQIGIFSAVSHKLIMGAALENSPFFQHINPVCHSHCGKTVTDQNGGFALPQLPKMLENFVFGLDIQ
jgi:hypothetical protein